MTATENEQLSRECVLFANYLVGLSADHYVIEKYVDAHHNVASYDSARRFDLFLIRFAAIGPAFVKLADCYARLAAPASLLRKKLILLLAILESSFPGHQVLDAVDGHGLPGFFLRALQKAVVFALSSLLATLVLFPCHVVLGWDSESQGDG